MTFDLVVRGGTVVDGSGSAAYSADIGIRAGRIAEIGRIGGNARRVIDASGALVTPGFTDIHCHYDGQISWDEELSPSSLHGVTTVVLGNCGVGFAPVRERDRARLIALMEGVEDIPGSALSEGINWEWESFPEYMRALDARPHAIDFGLQIPHDALRVYVMGDRAIAGEAANEDEIASMRELVKQALDAGAIGFSTGRSDNHRAADGGATPASEAEARELAGIARAFAGRESGVLQAVSDFDMNVGDERFDAEFDVLERMAEAAGGRPTSVSLMQRDQAPNQWRRILERVERAHARGVPMRVQAGARGIGVLLGFEATFHPFMGFPSYKRIAHLPLGERVRQLADPAVRARLLTEKHEPVAGDGSPIPPLADKLLEMMDVVAMRLFRLGSRPNYEPAVGESIAAEAFARNVSTLEAVYDALLEDDGKALLYFPIYNYTEMSLDNVRSMLTHPLALPGLSDGGAHVGTVCDASFSTFLLTHWARDRQSDRLPLERVVQMLGRDTARYVGLSDRGEIALGQRADLNVIDFDRLGLARPEMVFDLPAGGRRLVQRAEGYLATLVAGEIVLEADRLTGARPGKLATPKGSRA
ncbi:MAG: amidohydrolase family protein [Polyangiaceae bacterium]|nr:amidohydrolase family protein [Polyangiaceae bacterium]MCE7890222.1 D-aminoacylase [Sorangiineae bacterium PRO1]MCL4750144.1 amidohydrolase family protein [Myxococcales bacterium]MCL4750688.1 amidohydrolase family protein [Myxococcales bacterium]